MLTATEDPTEISTVRRLRRVSARRVSLPPSVRPNIDVSSAPPVHLVSSRACLRGLRVLSQSVALDVGGDVLLLLF